MREMMREMIVDRIKLILENKREQNYCRGIGGGDPKL